MTTEEQPSRIDLKQNIARKFVLYLLISSAFISLCAVIIEIYDEYGTQLQIIDNRFDNIEKANHKSIINALWIADTQQINIILRGITQFPDIEYVMITEGNKIIYKSGNIPSEIDLTKPIKSNKNYIVQQHSLYKSYQGKEIKLGTITIATNLAGLYSNLTTIGSKTFYTELVKIIIITLLIFFVFYRLVGRHLENMARYARSLNIEKLDTPLKLDNYEKNPNKQDELSHLVNAINEMRRNLQTSNEERNTLIQSLASSEALFRGILESSADGVLLINSKGEIDLVNKAILDLTGFTENEIIGHSIEKLVPKRFAQHKQQRQEYSHKPSRRPMGLGMSLTIQCKNNSEIPVEISLTPVTTDKGNITAAMVQDISLRRQTEEEKEKLLQSLESKNAELERFTYTASHDLKSPLVTISGFIGLLKNDIAAGNAERIEADLTRIGDAAKTMQQLLDDLLALSRIGRATSPRTNVNINNLINDVLELLAGIIESTGAIISVEENLPNIMVEEQRFKEIYLNLIENALKYRSPDITPKIHIGIRHNNVDDSTVFYVSDNGIGIEPCYYHKIFGLFDRLDHDIEGSGIGLAIVKRIIEVHGGTIWVETGNQGRGSTFCFSITENK